MFFINVIKNLKTYAKYLLDKLYNSDSVPKEIFNNFNNSLSNLKSKNKKYLLIIMMMVK